MRESKRTSRKKLDIINKIKQVNLCKGRKTITVERDWFPMNRSTVQI